MSPSAVGVADERVHDQDGIDIGRLAAKARVSRRARAVCRLSKTARPIKPSEALAVLLVIPRPLHGFAPEFRPMAI